MYNVNKSNVSKSNATKATLKRTPWTTWHCINTLFVSKFFSPL